MEEIKTINKIAQHINNYINANLAAKKCEICGDYCRGYSWSIHYVGYNKWGFSLYHHKKEIGYAYANGTPEDILLAGYEVMIRERWGL